MKFPAHLYLIALVGAALTTLLVVPLWRTWCRRVGLVDDPGERKIHAQPIPLGGGLAVMTGMLLPLVLLAAATHWHWFDADATGKMSHGLARRSGRLIAIFGGAIGMLALGWLDDKHELRPGLKFTGQLVVAFAIAASGIRITLFVPYIGFSFLVTVLWILTVTNAFNFMDNMNGLCGGLAAIAALFLGLSAGLRGQYLVASLSFLVAGAVLGFLPYNFPRASIFLGDAGSHLLGYLLAVLAILPHFYSAQHPQRWAVLNPLLILAVPLADLVWVVLLRWRAGKPFYIGDNNHLSHRLVRKGLGPALAVVVIWVLAAVIGAVTLLSG